MTEEIPATPAWGVEGLDEVFATLPDSPAIQAARAAYETCLASRKSPAAPSDMLGAEFNGCREVLRRALAAEGVGQLDAIDARLEALEAEIAINS